MPLFKEVQDVVIVGDELPVPVAEPDEFRAALAEREGRRALALTVDYNTVLLERAGDLVMTAERSSGADPDMRRLSEEGAAASATNVARLVQALAGHGSLRPGLDVTHAADLVFTLMSPHVHHLLRRLRGWTAGEYRAWLLDALVRELLPD